MCCGKALTRPGSRVQSPWLPAVCKREMCTPVKPCVVPLPTQRHQPANEHQSACSETEDLFMCQQSQQRTETPVLRSLITPSAINFTNEPCKVSSEPGTLQQNYLLAYYNTTASSCHSALWFAGVTSFWLCVGGIRCVARGCRQ